MRWYPSYIHGTLSYCLLDVMVLNGNMLGLRRAFSPMCQSGGRVIITKHHGGLFRNKRRNRAQFGQEILDHFDVPTALVQLDVLRV